MEFSEAFRAEDISKTDFFDFVVTPEDMGNDIVLHNNFPAWSRKGLFAGGSAATDQHAAHKETNNNVLPSFTDDCFWDTGGAKAFAAAAAAVNIKMESPTLEDINDICWPPGVERPEGPEGQHATEDQDGDADTDGSIYTLTVVNGQDVPRAPAAAPGPPGPPGPPDAPPLWYRPPDLIEGDEQLRMSSMDPDQTSLDIDSIISILPSLPSMAGLGQGLGHDLFNGQAEHGDDLLASSTACDDSGFVESKDDPKQPAARLGQGLQDGATASDHQQQHQQQQQPFSENNNDWAYSNHNESHGHSTAESLLRSALQGGKAYLSQYQDTKTLTELGPPGPSGPPDHASLGLFMGGDGLLPMDGMLPYDDGGDAGMYTPSSTPQCPSACASACAPSTCMDDILLSPLDDYEKLKMIENEVAESAKRYGAQHHVNGLGHDQGHGLGHGQGHGHFGTVPTAATAPRAAPRAVPHAGTTAPRPKKKGSKRSGDRPPGKTKSVSSGVAGGLGPGPGPGPGPALPPSANGGARRERSLHHCTICSKAFKDKYSVNVHIRTHTGEKPFACSVCGKSFRQKAHLAKHYHTHIVQKSEHLGPPKAVSTKAR